MSRHTRSLRRPLLSRWLRPLGAAVLAAALALPACATTAYERGVWQRLEAVEKRTGPASRPAAPVAPGSHHHGAETAGHQALLADGTLDSYLSYAAAHSPVLEAHFEDWRAAVHAIARSRRWPEPQLTYGLFLRQVETRVGPQRQRFGLRQMIPWPATLQAAADAAASAALAAERRFEAEGLALESRVAEAYWGLWQVQRTRAIRVEQRALLDQLAAMIRTRIEIGKASLADAAQLDLAIARLDDSLLLLDEDRHHGAAELRAVIGAPPDQAIPVVDSEPVIAVPAMTPAELRVSARSHPLITGHEAVAEMGEHDARRARAMGWPGLTLGLDYIDVGPATVGDQPDSGKDAVIATIGLSLPLWRGSYRSEARSAEARAAAARARQRAAVQHADSGIHHASTHVAATARRVRLYQRTLLPQSDTVYEAVIGAYQTGAAPLADALAAQRSILELRIQHVTAQADHARAWARLEAIVGREIARTEAP